MEVNCLKDETDSMKLFIDFIGGLYEDYFFEKFNCESKIFFTHGGCYILAKILKYFFKDEVKIMFNNDIDHIMIKYNHKLYDIYGINNDGSYRELSEIELCQCEEYNMADGGQIVYNTLIEEIPNCNMELTIEKIKKYKK